MLIIIFKQHKIDKQHIYKYIKTYTNILVKHMSFIPFFTELQHQKQSQHPTENTIPDSPLTINPIIHQLLNKPNPICVIGSVINSEEARKFTRSVFFSYNNPNNVQDIGSGNGSCSFINFDPKNDNILVYSKIQTGYNQNGDSVNWVYFQVDANNQDKYVSMLSSISCVLLYESQNLEIDRIYLEKTINNFKLLFGKNPVIFYLTNQDQNQLDQIIKKYKCQIISLKCLSQSQVSKSKKINSMEQIQLQPLSSSKANSLCQSKLYSSLTLEDASLFQTIIQTNRKIMAQIHVLQLSKDKPISSAVIPHMLKKWQQQSSYKQIQNTQKIYQFAVKQLEKCLKQSCINQYKDRMRKLYEDKKFISMKLLRNSHQLSVEIALKMIQKYKLPSLSLVQDTNSIREQVQKILQQQLARILEQTIQINMKWGKSFIQTQYNQIQSRLKNKQLKQINSLKSQFNLFAQYFHKKVQNLGCKKLEMHFQTFLVQKIFQCCNNIYENQKKYGQVQFTQLKNKLTNAQNQTKQLKRQLLKQSNQSTKNTQSLNLQIMTLKTKQQLLQSTISHLKQTINQLQQTNQSKILQLQQQSKQRIQQIEGQKYTLQQQISNLIRKTLSLQSQIQKQKQMHKQTQQHYTILVEDFKLKQKQLKQQIKDIEGRVQRQIQQIKKQSQKQLNQSSINKTMKQKQGLKLQQQCKQLNNRYNQLQKQYNNIKYQLQLTKASHQTQKTDLQLSLNLAQQKLCDHESKQPRYKKLQSQLQQKQRINQQLVIQLKEIQKQAALLKQQNQFINQHYKQIQAKYEGQKIKYEEIKAAAQILQEKVEKMNKVKVNQWVQTQFNHDNKFKPMLEEAINMVAILQNQYSKVKTQNARLRYRLANT